MNKSTRVVLLAAFCLVFGALAHADTYNFANTTSSYINFDGAHHFYFGLTGSPLGTGADSFINGADGGLGPLLNLVQDINGSFTIGAITTNGATQTASVSGTANYKIWNPTVPTDFLQGTITWIDIQTQGTGGTLNLNGILNVNYGAASGTNAGLNFLANKGGTAGVTFQFIPSKTLTQLDASQNRTSFSGTVSVPDGGTTLILLGGALIGLTTLRRKFHV